MTCHAPGQMPEATALGDVNHPSAECAACHDPHEARFGHFLDTEPAARCRECHTPHEALAGGPHDLLAGGTEWPAVSSATQDRCLACHRPHGTPEGGLLRAGLEAGVEPEYASCLPCHGATNPHRDSPLALVHPRAARTLVNPPPEVPLGQSADGTLLVGCRTCHDPHRDPATSEDLLRAPPGQPAQELCMSCHRERENIHMIGHAAEVLARYDFHVEACGPCHVTHAAPDGVEPGVLWPLAFTPADMPSGPTVVADRHCLACHRENGPVAPPAVAWHPEVEMFNPDLPEAPGFLPLFDENGNISPTGHIGCRTCHLTHGRSEPAPLPPEVALRAADRELRARQWHIRLFAPTNVCSTCHGVDALRRFIYFHDAARRSGPIEGGR